MFLNFFGFQYRNVEFDCLSTCEDFYAEVVGKNLDVFDGLLDLIVKFYWVLAELRFKLGLVFFGV